MTIRFKTNLQDALNDTFPNAGAIRLEARNIFVARVIDVINAALSKHDQVFIPATTRLGRVRASIPTCMACDRPLSTKWRKPTSVDAEKKTAVGIPGKFFGNKELEHCLSYSFLFPHIKRLKYVDSPRNQILSTMGIRHML